jgi:cbb3-type cytochrome oxidase maturation protein
VAASYILVYRDNKFAQNKNYIPLSALFVLIGISIIVAGSFLAAFLWSVNKGQFEDDYTPSVRMLFDDELKTAATTDTTIKK